MWKDKCERRESDRSKECPLRRPLSPLTGVNGRTGHNKQTTTHIPTLHMHRDQTQNVAVSPFSFALVKKSYVRLRYAGIVDHSTSVWISDRYQITERLLSFQRNGQKHYLYLYFSTSLFLCIMANTKLHVPPTC